MIPQDYDQWHSCITVQCKMKLTKEFATKRLQILNDANAEETLRMKELYGEQHIENLKNWFRRHI